jgi:hypothetical protein
MERFPVTGVSVYTLNICTALGDHEKCPGMGTLNVDGLKLGMTMCDCDCHRKPDAEVIEMPQRNA